MGWQDDPVVPTAQPAWMNDPIAEQAAPAPQDPGMLANAARAARMGLPFGNQFVAAEKTILPQSLGGSPGFDYGKNLADVNAADARLQQQHPVIADLGQGAGAALGALAVPAAVLGEGAQGLGLLGRATRGGLTGAGLGAVQGAGAPGSDIRNLPQTAEGGVGGLYTGAALGSAFPVLGAGIGKGYSALADALRGGPGPADLAGLQAAKSAAYQNVKDLGAAYSPEAFSSLVNDIASSAKEKNINPKLHSGAASIISDMQARAEEGTPVTLPELDQMRITAWRDSAGKQGPDSGAERFFGNQIRNKITEFTNSAFPGNMAPMPAAPETPAIAPPTGGRASIRAMTPEEEAAADFSGGHTSQEQPAAAGIELKRIPYQGGEDFENTSLFEVNKDGQHIGNIYVNDSDPKNLRIDHFESTVSQGSDRINSLGTSTVRDIRDKIQSIYPDAENVSGTRISGNSRSRLSGEPLSVPLPSRPRVTPGPAPTPMLDFLRRGGGLQDEGGDLKSMGFTNLNETQGRDERGRFGALQKGTGQVIDKENGVPMDEGLRAAKEAGYMEPHETVADFINKIGEHPTYSVHDQEAVAARAARDEYDFGPNEEAPKLVVAQRMPDGTVKYGNPGDLHSDLPFAFSGRSKDMGFAQSGGPFMSREEAANFVAQNEPWKTPENYEPGESFLQAEPYTEADRLNRFDLKRGGGAESQSNLSPIAPAIATGPTASAQEAADAINAARDLAQRQFKANALTKALRQADLSTAWSGIGGNIENNTRRLLGRTLAKEPWSQEEKDQLERIIMGTPVTNTLRKVSRLSPLSHSLMGGGELAATIATGSPWPAAAAGTGMAAQALGALARRNAQNKLLETILAGGNAPAQAASTPRLSRAAIAAALAANANLQGQRNQAPQP